tara:strand:- start:779 stop:1261 length:483 start_codon:yes stop_codon:yes gene_type:complete
MRSDVINASSGSHNYDKRRIQNIDNSAALTRTMLDSESGTLFLVDMSTVDNNVTLTLPTASGSAGVWFDFCFTVNCDDDADFIVTTGDNDTDIYGYIVAGAANSTVDDVDGLSKITIDGSVSQAIEGLRMTFLCDGTNWHLSGYVPVAIGTVVVVESATA